MLAVVIEVPVLMKLIRVDTPPPLVLLTVVGPASSAQRGSKSCVGRKLGHQPSCDQSRTRVQTATADSIDANGERIGRLALL